MDLCGFGDHRDLAIPFVRMTRFATNAGGSMAVDPSDSILNVYRQRINKNFTIVLVFYFVRVTKDRIVMNLRLAISSIGIGQGTRPLPHAKSTHPQYGNNLRRASLMDDTVDEMPVCVPEVPALLHRIGQSLFSLVMAAISSRRLIGVTTSPRYASVTSCSRPANRTSDLRQPSKPSMNFSGQTIARPRR